jgi:3-methyladenine DNA glycosylase/8-oxoguanine DNA glycosylase
MRAHATGVALRVIGPDAAAGEVVAPLAARARRALRLDEDLRPFHALCRREPALRPIARGGLGRLLRGTTLFEDAVTAIVGGNTGWPAAVASVARLGHLGAACAADRELHAFPTPSEIVGAGLLRLRGPVGLGQRAASVLGLAHDVGRGTRDLAALDAAAAAMSTVALDRALRRIRGVGPATTPWLLAMLGHYDLPLLDRATRAWASRALPGARDTERRLRRYGSWSGLVLWCQRLVAGTG